MQVTMTSSVATQNRNTARLVMSTFHRLHQHIDKGVTPAEITGFLRYQFGGLWKNELTQKAEQTLRQCMNLGFLERKGNRYIMAKPGKRFISTLDPRKACGLGSTQKTRCRHRRSESRRRRRGAPPPRRRAIRRRRTCVQGRVRKKRMVRALRASKSDKEEDEGLELMDDDDDGSQGTATT